MQSDHTWCKAYSREPNRRNHAAICYQIHLKAFRNKQWKLKWACSRDLCGHQVHIKLRPLKISLSRTCGRIVIKRSSICLERSEVINTVGCKIIGLVPNLHPKFICKIESALVISKTERVSEILRDIRNSIYQINRFEENMNRPTTFHKWICNLIPEVRDTLIIYCKKRAISPLFHGNFVIYC